MMDASSSHAVAPKARMEIECDTKMQQQFNKTYTGGVNQQHNIVDPKHPGGMNNDISVSKQPAPTKTKRLTPTNRITKIFKGTFLKSNKSVEIPVYDNAYEEHMATLARKAAKKASTASPYATEKNLYAVLPPQHARFQGKLTLVLDIDETLVHSCIPEDADVYRQEETRKKTLNSAYKDSFELYLDNCDHRQRFTVHKRPGLEEFLRSMAEKYEVIAYTAGMCVCGGVLALVLVSFTCMGIMDLKEVYGRI